MLAGVYEGMSETARQRMLYSESTSRQIIQLCHCTLNLYLESHELVVAGIQNSSEPLANRKICIQSENKEGHNQSRTSARNDHPIFL